MTMRILKKVLCAYISCLLLGPMTAVANYTVAIDPTVSWGIWEGWGTSLAWWASRFGNRDDLANVMFTTNTSTLFANNGSVQLPGLGLNIARFNAGASSWNSYQGQSMVESPNIFATRQIEGFWQDWGSTNPASSSWDWTADANQVAMLHKARDRGADQFELFSNSPMWWMCYNKNPSGADIGNNDNLQSWNYSDHALYMATVAKYAQDNWGIVFDSVDPFNEPIADWWNANGTQEGCHFAVSTQTNVIGLLRDELDNRNLTSTMIAASDESTYDMATATWNSFSASTKAKVGRVNVHGYQYEGGARHLLDAAVHGDGKPLWNSEYGDNDATGVRLARCLNYDFRWMRLTAWCYWQPLDWADWGLIDANLESSWIGQPETKYYVLAQYTRHIRPGMTILDGYQGDSVIAYSAAERKLVIVTMNYDAPQTITYDLSSFFEAAGPVRRWRTEAGSGSVNYVASDDIVIANKSFSVSFATNTIQTFEIHNVDIIESLPPPQLTIHPITNSAVALLSWSSLYPDFNLYSATTLTNSSGWLAVTNTPTETNSTYQVTVPIDGSSSRFFRLSNP